MVLTKLTKSVKSGRSHFMIPNPSLKTSPLVTASSTLSFPPLTLQHTTSSLSSPSCPAFIPMTTLHPSLPCLTFFTSTPASCSMAVLTAVYQAIMSFVPWRSPLTLTTESMVPPAEASPAAALAVRFSLAVICFLHSSILLRSSVFLFPSCVMSSSSLLMSPALAWTTGTSASSDMEDWLGSDSMAEMHFSRSFLPSSMAPFENTMPDSSLDISPASSRHSFKVSSSAFSPLSSLSGISNPPSFSSS
mmetsp:Transcript_18762/g.39057  ORF Transcript_18762/g.39057 Transcript_18762/m.39057 type:complete len:247 (-) Transcript_18762:338-1078(-)